MIRILPARTRPILFQAADLIEEDYPILVALVGACAARRTGDFVRVMMRLAERLDACPLDGGRHRTVQDAGELLVAFAATRPRADVALTLRRIARSTIW